MKPERCLPEVEEWIAKHLPADYAWPGNYRELEQCVRNVIIRRSYQPLAQAPAAPRIAFSHRFHARRIDCRRIARVLCGASLSLDWQL